VPGQAVITSNGSYRDITTTVIEILYCNQVAQKARQRHQEVAAASKHALKSSLYWKGAFGRAHSNLTKSALQQVHKGRLAANHGLVNMGHERQAKGKQQHHERQLMGNYHGQLNMLKAFTLHTDLQHRCAVACCAVLGCAMLC